MWVLTLRCPESERELLLADLYARGTSGVVEEDLPAGQVELRAFFEDRFEPAEFTAWSPGWEPADDTNWTRKIMEDWDPVAVGERFYIAPDWRDDPTPPGRIRLTVNPGSVLGTGYHPTTQMCLEAMERYLGPADSFFDLGCGSGILSHAAWLLGPRKIIASDIDPHATSEAASYLRGTGACATIFTGSTRAVRSAAAAFLAANIGPVALLSLEPEITRCLAPGGRAVLSGFRPSKVRGIASAYQAAGYEVLWETSRDEWGCVVVKKLRGSAV